ncbi:SDR family NAD(P)-dependent oxidoreductase [Jatrophihabitans sp. DSM 45814]
MGQALVTGASSGIGAAFSRRLAAEARDLILVARDETRLDELAGELRDRYLVQVEVLPADLATDDGCERVTDRIAATDNPVDIVINNAGIGLYQAFGEASIDREELMLDINVRAVLRLTHAAVNAMVPRRRGEIVNVSSVAGFLPRGAAATYAASKSWVSSFTEGVALTLEDSGVRIGAICPGFVHTEFHQRAETDMSHQPSWMWLDADRVVAEGLEAIRGGKILSIPSRRYRSMVLAARIAPRPLLRKVMARR